MKTSHFSFNDSEGIKIYVTKWLPEEQPKAVVQIAHGMAERRGRYKRFGEVLTRNGFAVYINDHRGHGETAGNLENLGYIGEGDGFKCMVEDMKELNNVIKEDYTEIPVFLFGHSMGSFLSQKYISLYGNELKGVILSGTNGKAGTILNLGILIANIEMKKHGSKAKSERLNKLSFGNYNKAFKPNRTEFDWLSSDDKEVDKYIEDEYCGTVFTTSFYYYFLKGLKDIHTNEVINNINKSLPIYIFGGSKDPVGNNGKGIVNLYNMYKRNGIRNVKYKVYENGRHEMLNEVNRTDVMEDIVKWLNEQLLL
ncbi:alpha/beta hydrolase [Clostridium lundense]|uniref:alpha/beta hydrolase n=1 Tax=Clostridium lundense TaxID=319475 RepID=UPI0004822561|nr:alpha/beta hydrolase [Clostridium lundense]